ncbi:MAG: RnfABCDGE type electron transport complex subunit D, partial [Flavobacteriales bacterium]
MKPIKDILEKTKPHFEKGGKMEKFHTLFDAMETFLFVPERTTRSDNLKSGVHVRDSIDLKRTMMTVIIALIPCTLFGIWNTGYQHYLAVGEDYTFMDCFIYGLWEVLPIIIVSYVSGLTIEIIFATSRGEQVNEGFLVSGLLIPLVLPVSIPLWMVAVATIFAVLIGKEVFGGTGMNILNVALTARAFLFFGYPTEMSGN